MTPNTLADRPTLTLAARAWAHLMPLARGSVVPESFDLHLDLRDSTPDPLAEGPATVAETSFSSYVRALAAGENRLIGLPVFVMRAFRHRCVLVPQHSDLSRFEDLRGLTVGASGWPDSGNTWTRSLLRRAGVQLNEVKWLLAPLAGGQLEPSRVACLADNVAVDPAGRPLLEVLTSGRVDAVMAPFVPTTAHTATSPVRHLLPHYAADEAGYYADVGFVPGIHLLTMRRDLAVQHPWLPAAVVAVLQHAKDSWQAERWRYADTTPWMLRDLQRTDAVIGADWMPYGVSANAGMVAAFCTELAEQCLVPAAVDPATVFADYQSMTENERT